MGLDPVNGSSVKMCQKLTSCVAAYLNILAALPLTEARSGVGTFHHSQVSGEMRM